MKGKVTCISGIDTGIGKTIATGVLAKIVAHSGQTVITQKVVQTGCEGIAEDIVVHRQLMGINLLQEDSDGLTCPYRFSKACSPHLAARLEGKQIELSHLQRATKKLSERFEHVLLEGVGGLMVPLDTSTTFLDYLETYNYPLILVTSPRLGSINHTLSALELAKNRSIMVNGLVYNWYQVDDQEIAKDSRLFFFDALDRYGFSPTIVDLQPFTKTGEDIFDRNWLQLLSPNNK